MRFYATPVSFGILLPALHKVGSLDPGPPDQRVVQIVGDLCAISWLCVFPEPGTTLHSALSHFPIESADSHTIAPPLGLQPHTSLPGLFTLPGFANFYLLAISNSFSK